MKKRVRVSILEDPLSAAVEKGEKSDTALKGGESCPLLLRVETFVAGSES